MEITYRRCGDYDIPNISIPAENMHPLGKYGRMRLRYLREYQPLLFNQLFLSGRLMSHLRGMPDYQLQELKEEVRRPEVVKREFVRENKLKKPGQYKR